MDEFRRRVLTVVSVTALAVMIGLVLSSVVQVILLLFASVLLALFLRHVSA
jgi:hypothetical protein